MKAYSIGLYEKSMPSDLTWEEKLIAAKEAGYDFVEISIDETDNKLGRLDMGKEERQELLQLMDKIGLPIRTMCLSGHRKFPLGSMDVTICSRGMEIMEKAIALAGDLGIRIIQLAGYDVYYEESTAETKARFERNLKKITDLAAKEGVLLGFETMETDFMNTVEKSMKYVKLVNSPYLNVYPDMGNITNAAKTYGADVFEDIKKGAGHIIAAHLKETVPGKFREIAYGKGHVDFPGVIKATWNLGVRKYVTEFWYTGNPSWKEDLKSANKMMTELLDKEAG